MLNRMARFDFAIYTAFIYLIMLYKIQASAHPLEPRQNSTSIKWGKFPKEVKAPGLQCATYSVPLNWDEPGGEQISLGMAKLAGNHTRNHIGNLFINPGGPGGSAVAFLDELALGSFPYTGDRLRPHFDIIGIDPRGIGLSTPVQCDIDLWNQRWSVFPTDDTSYQTMVDYWRDVGESCRNMTGPLVDHVDTINVAKDLEAVRVALGNEKLNWLGLSYGTQLGAQYAELYPHNIRTMVLDGLVQHSPDEAALLISEDTTYDVALKKFFEWCGAENSTCALAGKDVAKVWNEVIGKAALSPIPALSCDNTKCRSDVNAEEIQTNTAGTLSLPFKWPTLGSALLNASQGDASYFSFAHAYGNAFDDSQQYGSVTVTCQDWNAQSQAFSDVQSKEILGNAFSPYTKGASQFYFIQTACIGWPAPLANPPKPYSVTGAPKMLLVNSNYDAETSYQWAMAVEKEIGNAVLLTRDGFGHTSYLLGGDTAKAMDAYMIDLILPSPGTILHS